ncbi:hypothetical protein JCM19379_22820 [Methyloparacoccus murrellii]
MLTRLLRSLWLAPPGWKLVPKTPTLAMIQAGHEAARGGVVCVWKAMVDAARDGDFHA